MRLHSSKLVKIFQRVNGFSAKLPLSDIIHQQVAQQENTLWKHKEDFYFFLLALLFTKMYYFRQLKPNIILR